MPTISSYSTWHREKAPRFDGERLSRIGQSCLYRYGSENNNIQ